MKGFIPIWIITGLAILSMVAVVFVYKEKQMASVIEPKQSEVKVEVVVPEQEDPVLPEKEPIHQSNNSLLKIEKCKAFAEKWKNEFSQTTRQDIRNNMDSEISTAKKEMEKCIYDSLVWAETHEFSTIGNSLDFIKDSQEYCLSIFLRVKQNWEETYQEFTQYELPIMADKFYGETLSKCLTE